MQKELGFYEKIMGHALVEAQKAYDRDEVPVGAVILGHDKRVVARAYNMVEVQDTQVAHAELRVLTKAGKKMGDWRLEGCWMYVTLEPCAMCLHAIIMSRMEGVVYGARSPLFGYHLDNYGTLSIYTNKQLPIEVIDGVMAKEAEVLLKEFFRKKRICSERSKNGSRSS